MGANNHGLGQISQTIVVDPPREEAAPSGFSFFELLGGLAISSFEAFFEYRPSHVEAFIASIFCLIFGIAIDVMASIRIEGIANMPIYFLVMSGSFFLIGIDLRRCGQR